MSKTYNSIFVSLAFPLMLFAQTEHIVFDHLSVNDGLSNSIIQSILQDSRGFMWFGTEDGLNKYDGYNFTVYRHNPEDSLSISGNCITALYESQFHGKQVLWIGTHSGLNLLDIETEQFTHFRNDPDDPQSLSHDRVISIYEDSFGEFWIGTDGGINILDRETKKFVRYQHDPKNPNSLSHNLFCTITETFTDGISTLWVGTFNGLNKFDRKTKKFKRYKHDPHNPNSLSYRLISFLFADHAGNLWISTNNGGLNKFNVKTEQFTRFQYDPDNPTSISANMIIPVLADKFQGQDVLWIGAFNGLDKLNLETEQFTHYKNNPDDSKSLCNNRVNALYKDKMGSIWVGTFGGGLSIFNPRRNKFEHVAQQKGSLKGLSQSIVLSIIESKYYGPNVFWIGTQAGGLNKYDRNTGSFTHYRYDPGNTNTLSNDFVITLFESHFQGRPELWIGTLDGLNKFDLRTKKFTRYQYDPDDNYSIRNNIIRSIHEDKSGILWIGTRNGGINRLDRSSERFLQKRYYIGETVAFVEDHGGTLWAGTHRGLARYNNDSQDFTHFLHDSEDPRSLSHNDVRAVYEDQSFRLWVGTSDGLNLYNHQTGQFTRYMVKDGLPSGVINAILEDKHGNLWLSTYNGLSKFNPTLNTFRNYDLLDGLQSNLFTIGSSCLSQKGDMLCGGTNGFNVFHPDSIRDNFHIPDIYLTDFRIFNNSVEINTSKSIQHDGKYYLPKHISNSSEITLSYKENIFSFEFAALDYFSPLKNQYAYMMVGVDPDWVITDASRRFATYTNLDPGEYLFKVRGSNNDGIWNMEGRTLKITITPPWWKSNLAYASYILLIVVIVVTTWRIQLRRIRLKQQLKMEHLEAEKLREVDHLKSRFFANISHEFRTPLTLIEGPAKQLVEGQSETDPKEQGAMILRNSKRLLSLINQILDLSKLESGQMKLQASRTDIIKYLKGLVFSFCSLADRNKIKLKFKSAAKTLDGYIDQDKIEKIITNLLSNAFKFTPENGVIQVTTKMSNVQTQMPNQFPIPNSQFQISVSNTGPAIPPHQLDRIFDRFYQADSTYKKDGDGSGIGLALTKELVELHHGSIEVDCVKGVDNHAPTMGNMYNTTFTIMLPIGKEHLSEDEIVEEIPLNVSNRKSHIPHRTSHISNPKSRIPVLAWNIANQESSIPDKPGSPLRPVQHPVSSILLVEDNPDVTSYICSFLNHDYRILTAENGKVGWKMAVGNYPDLIISDVMMPEMDGFELCKKIKSDQRTSHIPVILLTAKADSNSKIDGLEFGADDYISKPFDSNELKVRSKNLIEQRKKLRNKFAHMIEIYPGEVTATSMDKQFLNRLLDIFEDHVSDHNFSVDDFAREVGMSRSNLYRKIEALTNQSTHEFIRSLRLKRAAQLLKKSSGSVTDIAYAVGFNNLSYFSKTFRQQFGQTPREYASMN